MIKRKLPSVGFWFAVNMAAMIALVVVNFATTAPTLHWWPDAFAVLTNLSSGGLVSFLFYFLVVHLPEARRKAVIKANMLAMYKNIKEDILRAVVQASIAGGRRDLAIDESAIARLMSPPEFKRVFSGGQEANEGFYAFANRMSEDSEEFREIVSCLEVLSKQIEFVLHNYAIDDQKVFDFLKRLELLLVRFRAIGPGYDESKPLCRFIWELYAGWSFVDGDIGHDKIQGLIDGL